MADQRQSAPLILRTGQAPVPLFKLALGSRDYDELFIQKLAFENPYCLPVGDVDKAYDNLIPICMELETGAGPIDALYVTPTGRLALLEAKLWRNPEARRKVVAQILDYARELASWSYEDLQREVSKRTGRKGNALYDIVAEQHADTDEADFVDEIQRSLRRGRFLLLIVGDGIREGAGAIASFLDEYGSLEFTFGLVELSVFKVDDDQLLVVPQVLAKTVILDRRVVSLPDGAVLAKPDEDEPDEEASRELSESNQFYLAFWKEFTAALRLDDPGQPVPRTTKIGNLYFSMPPSGGVSWVSLFFSRRLRRVGVYLTFSLGSFADRAYASLLAERTDIEAEIGLPLEWEAADGKYKIAHRKEFDDVWSDKNRQAIKDYFSATANRFVNAFRPRLEKIAESIT